MASLMGSPVTSEVEEGTGDSDKEIVGGGIGWQGR